MNDFECIIKNCLEREFGDRVKKYYYFDAKEYIKPDNIKLEFELYTERKSNNDILHECEQYIRRENAKYNNRFLVSFDFNKIRLKNEYAIEFYNKYISSEVNKISDEDIEYIKNFYYNNIDSKINIKSYRNYSFESTFEKSDDLTKYYSLNFTPSFRFGYCARLIILFVFKYSQNLVNSKYINVKFNSLINLNSEQAILKEYLSEKIVKFQDYNNASINNNELMYVFYVADKVKINVIDCVEKFLKYDLNVSLYYFRGHSKVNYKLIPSAFRDNGIDEKKIVDEVCAEYPKLFSNLHSIDILTNIQHFGGKTRLLDITDNPLVAMFFACCDNIDEAGEIIVLKRSSNNFKNSDTVSMLSCLSLLGNDKLDIIKKSIKTIKFVKNKAVLQLEHLVRQERIGFKFNGAKAIKDLNKCVYCTADKVNERIIRQSGSFVLCGIDVNKTEEFLNENRKSENQSNVKSIYLVCNKREIINELNGFGINYHYLFPELENYFLQQKL